MSVSLEEVGREPPCPDMDREVVMFRRLMRKALGPRLYGAYHSYTY
ncbi:hypothetical protein [Streptomyces sp. NPDC018000]